MLNRLFVLAFVLIAALCDPVRAQGLDPLPSWNDGAAKRAITAFVARVTTEGSAPASTIGTARETKP